jgi:ubiquinone/menaquinone biosynthesis C-methylase UbiE
MPLTLEPLATAVLHVPIPPERILEIDCGEGDGVLFLAREFPAARVRGVDRSEEAIKGAVARVGLDPEGRVAFKHREPRALPYPDGHFDLVVQRRGALQAAEVARVLRPDGCILYAEHPAPWATRLRALLARRKLERLGFETIGKGEGEDWSFYVWRRPL